MQVPCTISFASRLEVKQILWEATAALSKGIRQLVRIAHSDRISGLIALAEVVFKLSLRLERAKSRAELHNEKNFNSAGFSASRALPEGFAEHIINAASQHGELPS